MIPRIRALLYCIVLFAMLGLTIASVASDPLSLAQFDHDRKALRGRADRIRLNRCRGHVQRFGHPASWFRPEGRQANLRYWHRRIAAVRDLKSRCVPWYVTKQIRIATKIGGESLGDPWPNCPDPFDGGGYSWRDTVACENRGYHELYGFPREFLDSPGYYRCGLQFDPSWERAYGRLCP